MKTKTHKDFIEEVRQVHPSIEILGQYIGTHTKIECKCNICGCQWEATPHSLLQKHGCPRCSHQSGGDKRRKTHEYFIMEMQQRHPNIKILSEYKGSNKNVLCQCTIDGHTWSTTPIVLLDKRSKFGCKVCASKAEQKERTKTKEQLQAEINVKTPYIVLIGDYINMETPTTFKCLMHDEIFPARPANVVYRGFGCSKCTVEHIQQRSLNQVKTHDQFIHDLQEKNNRVDVIGTYINSHTKIKVKCKKCGYEWETYPTIVMGGSGCPSCNNSKGENKIEDWLLQHNILYQLQYTFEGCKHIKQLPFDFYLPDLNILIEYDGQQHYYPVGFGSKDEYKIIEHFNKTQENDIIKNQYCADNNIKLIRIPYWDFDNIEEILTKELNL